MKTEEQSRQIMIVQAKPKTKATIALLKLLAVTWFCPRRLMENPGERLKENEREKQGKKVYHHYAHTDPCKDTRWTAKYFFPLFLSLKIYASDLPT